MATIISITNQKGGVGKTTTTHSIGAGLYLRGLKVLYVDLDPQCNLSLILGKFSVDNNARTLLCTDIDAKSCIQRTDIGDIISSSIELASADIDIIKIGKEYRLREKLAEISDIYDYILIDTPPSLGILTVNALTTSDGIIIPAQADLFSLQGIHQLYSTINTVKKYCNPALKVYGMVITRYNQRTIISVEMADTIEERAKELATKLFNSKIRECINLKEIQVTKQDIFTYSPKSNAAIDYNALIDEILEVQNG